MLSSAEEMLNMRRQIARLWKKATAFVAVEVPAEVAACEFDCRELNCKESQWASCPRRVEKSQAIADLAHAAAQASVSPPSSPRS